MSDTTELGISQELQTNEVCWVPKLLGPDEKLIQGIVKGWTYRKHPKGSTLFFWNAKGMLLVDFLEKGHTGLVRDEPEMISLCPTRSRLALMS